MSRAVRFTRTGGPDVLELVEVEEPHAGEAQVRIAVRAAGLNPFDSKVRSGAIPRALPSGQGAEFAGVVDEVGPGVEASLLGTEVLGWIASGAQADHVVTAATSVAPKPTGLAWAGAGGLGLVANTASRAIRSLDLSADDTVLITGASGAVGMVAAQFALAVGTTVVGTARESDHGFLRDLGVIPVAYGAGEVDRLRAAAAHYTAALDTAGRPGVLSALAVGVSPSRVDSVADAAAGAEFGIMTIGGGGKTAEELAGFARALAEGQLVLPVHATFPLEEAVEAYRFFESEHVLGKVVLVAG